MQNPLCVESESKPDQAVWEKEVHWHGQRSLMHLAPTLTALIPPFASPSSIESGIWASEQKTQMN